MCHLLKTLALVAIPILMPSNATAAQSSYDLRSPNGKIEIRIRTASGIRYDVLFNGRALLQDCALSLDVDHKKLGVEAKVLKSKESSRDQTLEPVVRQKFAQIRENYKELRLDMDGGYAVVFRAYNEGAAYRLETSLPQPEVKIYAEEMNLNFPSNFIVYYPTEESFFSHNERKYLPQHLAAIDPAFIATLPAVIDVDDGAKVAIAESDVEEYPGLWLRGTGGNGLAATFPPYPLKEKLERDRDVRVVESADYIAVTKGTRTFPWRIIGIAEKDGDLLTNQLTWLLAKPSQVQDTSWYKPGNVLDVVPEINMEELSAYAKQKKVGIILWVIWNTLGDQLEKALDQYE